MRRHVRFFLIIACAGFLQVSVLAHLRVMGVKPDLPLVCAVCAVFLFPPRPAVLYAFCAGLLQDVLGTQGAHCYALLFSLGSLILISLAKKFSFETALMRALCVVSLVVLQGIIMRMVFVSVHSVPFGIFLRLMALEAFFTCALAPWLCGRIERWVGVRAADEEEEFFDREAAYYSE